MSPSYLCEPEMTKRLIAVAAAFLFVFTSSSLMGETFLWPGFLGPHRTGWIDGVQAPERWPDKAKQVWQVNVGTGYGSPLVANDNVYQHARQNDDEVLWCVDLRTGKTKWRKSLPVPFKIAGGGERHGKGPKSCPVYADGRVFTLSINGVLSAWDAQTGDALWSRDERARFPQNHPNWGASTSPIIDGKRLLVHLGNDDAGALIAFDVSNGNQLWSQGKDGTSYSSPLVGVIDGVKQVIQWNHQALVGVDIETGQLLWEKPFPHVTTNQNMPTPSLHNGSILLGGENRGIHRFTPKQVDGNWSVTEDWVQEKLALDMSTAVVNGDRLFGFSHYDSGRLFCLDTETGKTIWQSPPRVGQNVAFLSLPGFVLALVNNGELQVIKSDSSEYEKVASYQVAEDEAWAPPVMMQDAILVKGKQTLTRWSFK